MSQWKLLWNAAGASGGAASKNIKNRRKVSRRILIIFQEGQKSKKKVKKCLQHLSTFFAWHQFSGQFCRAHLKMSSTAKLWIWTLRIWGLRGPGFRSARQVLCRDASRLFLDHFSKHLSSVLGRTELCHEVQNPGPQKPQITCNENHHLALLENGTKKSGNAGKRSEIF